MANKVGFANIKQEAKRLSEDQGATAFVDGARNTPTITTVANPKPSHAPAQPILVVEGTLKNRSQACRPSTQLYLLNQNAQWIDTYASGSQQKMLNYLIKRGIDAVEQEAKKTGMVFVRDVFVE